MNKIKCTAVGPMGLFLLIGTAYPLLSNAQQSPTGDEALGVEEIIVTGQKRSENIQDIPKQVAVASNSDLKSAGVDRLTDLQKVFPTITMQQNGPGLSPRPPGIRGIAPFSFSVGVQSQTGIVVDDVPQGTFSTLAFELGDVERVEVFAGPQTTLSGRNASAGLINVVTRAPSFEPALDVGLDFTNDNQSRVTAFATGPLSDTVAYSLSLLQNDWDGPYQNGFLDNEPVGGFDTNVARGKLLWEPNETLSATLTGYYVRSEGTTGPVLGQDVIISGPETGFFGLDAEARSLTELYPGIDIDEDNRSIYSPENGEADTRDQGVSLKVDYNAGSFGSLSSITSYTESSQPRTDIFIGAPRDNLFFPVDDFVATADIQTNNFTQEFRLTSDNSSKFSYLIGGIYSRIHVHQIYLREELFPFAATQDFDNDSAAIFARGTYDLTPNGAINVGLRYQHDKLSYHWDVLTAGDTVSNGDDSNGFWGGEFGYTHTFDDGVSVYATYSHAETGNAYNLNDVATASTGESLPVIPSTKAKNFEVGVKSQLLDDKLILNLDIFRTEYDNFQIQDTRVTDNSIVTDLAAIGAVKTEGVELQVRYNPTSQLSLGLSSAYIDARVTDYPNASCYPGQTVEQGCVEISPDTFRQENISGNQLPFSPEWRLTANADYFMSLTNFDFKFGGFYRYQSESTGDLFGNPYSEQDGYGTLNLYAGPVSKDERWSAEFFVNNVFDERYYSNVAVSEILVPFSGDDPVLAAIYDRNTRRYAGVRIKWSW
ncbi:MAG: TonB-dependent receptor [Porticoccaceae bacterium]